MSVKRAFLHTLRYQPANVLKFNVFHAKTIAKQLKYVEHNKGMNLATWTEIV